MEGDGQVDVLDAVPQPLELLEVDAAFALQANVDHCQVVFDRGHGALDDAAFKAALSAVPTLKTGRPSADKPAAAPSVAPKAAAKKKPAAKPKTAVKAVPVPKKNSAEQEVTA